MQAAKAAWLTPHILSQGEIVPSLRSAMPGLLGRSRLGGHAAALAAIKIPTKILPKCPQRHLSPNRLFRKVGGYRLKIVAHPQIHHLGLEAALQFGIVAAGNRNPIG